MRENLAATLRRVLANHMNLVSLKDNLHDATGSRGLRQAGLPDFPPVVIVDTHYCEYCLTRGAES